MTQEPETRERALAGCRIVVPESRELDVFAAMLEAQGATTLRCPMVAILDLEDDAAALAWLRRLAAGGLDDLVLLTGEGLRRLAAVARESHLEDALAAGLARTRTAAVGPVVAAAITAMGGTVAIMPGDSFHMKPLVRAICAALAPSGARGRP